MARQKVVWPSAHNYATKGASSFMLTKALHPAKLRPEVLEVMSTAAVVEEFREENIWTRRVGVRLMLLMCAPTLYDVNYVINPWMAGNVHASSRERAIEQWGALYRAIRRVADVELVEPQPGSPDMVFTANAGLERSGTVMLSSFFHAERQGEEPYFRQWFRDAGYTVLELPRGSSFEGEGDALFSIDGQRLWVGYGPRTLRSSHQQLATVWPVEVSSLHLIDPRFYHLDTCFAPLEDGFVLYYPAAFDETSLAAIEAFYPLEKRIIVEEADALRFACNAVNIGKTIFLNCISEPLAARLETLGFELVQLDLSEFLKAGGAAKCLVMKLSALPLHLESSN